MGFRFSKRISILPGVRVNLSGSGASLSVGPRGASITMGKRGVHGNVGIPGTGLSYRKRLDQPKPATPASPKPRLPDELAVQLHDDGVEILDGRGRPIDPILLPAARRLLKTEMRELLDRSAADRNAFQDELRHLHHDVPRTVATTREAAEVKPQREFYADSQTHMQAVMEWRARTANATPDHAAVEAALLAALGALEWPHETDMAVCLTDDRLLLDVDLPEIEDMPQTRWAVDGTRLSLVQREATQKDRAGLYLDHVCSLLVRIIGHAMATSVAIRTVAISAYTRCGTSRSSRTPTAAASPAISTTCWNIVLIAS